MDRQTFVEDNVNTFNTLSALTLGSEGQLILMVASVTFTLFKYLVEYIQSKHPTKTAEPNPFDIPTRFAS